MIEEFRQRILAGAPLRLRGGGSKDFYGEAGDADCALLETAGYGGILEYEPTELYISARCGAPLLEIEAELERHGQCLAFEPPRYSSSATIGGAVAAGLSGPRRASVGALRDFMLGVRMLDGAGRELKFGGRVIKNVAGYDASRLMCGALGAFGLLLETTLKVLPKPAATCTMRLDCPQQQALQLLNGWAGRPLPLAASIWRDDVLTLRLAGARAGVAAAVTLLRDECGLREESDEAIWDAVRDHADPFFTAAGPLWRLSVPASTPPLPLSGATLVEWGGAQRWLRSEAPPATIRAAAAQCGGHATLFRAAAELKAQAGVFQPLPPAQMQLQQRLKAAFDPGGVFNPGRLYRGL